MTQIKEPEGMEATSIPEGMYLTLTQVAMRRNVIKRTAQQWIDKGWLPAIDLPGMGRVVLAEDVDGFEPPGRGQREPRTKMSLVPDEQLREYSEQHLLREVTLLHWTVSVLHAFQSSPGVGRVPGLAWATDRAYIEAFAMHARNLIDFLYSGNRARPTDVVIERYIDPAVLAEHLPAMTRLLEHAKTNADKQIAHLTFDRLNAGMFERSWAYTEIFADITKAFNSVSSFFDAGKTSERFRAAIAPPQPAFIPVRVEELRSASQQPTGINLFLAR